MELWNKFNSMKTFSDKNFENRSENSYKFYVKSAKFENGCGKGEPPEILPGEIVIAEAHSVMLCPLASDREKYLIGDLFVTNFRVFFKPSGASTQKENFSQKNRLLGEHATCLSNIDAIYHIDGDKSRRLYPHCSVQKSVKGLQLVCKNFRVFNFSFEKCTCNHWENVTKTVLHHAYPGRHSLLFAYEFSGSESAEDQIDNDVILFDNKEDWKKELTRNYKDNVNTWKFTEVNRSHSFNTFLPEWVIVPKKVLDNDLQDVSNAFRYNRLPTWTWSHSNGAALVRLSLLLQGVPDRTKENTILEKIRSSHPSLKAPEIIELDKYLPSPKEINVSFLKLRDLCVPDCKRLKFQESKFYVLLENTKWLSYVSATLKIAVDSVNFILSGSTVVLQEGDGRDTSAVVASLIQLMMDSTSRTIQGFQSLIQKEWIALGHPFATRLGLIQKNDVEQERSPVFLLFLDCVWQLQNQFPTKFQFSETYLTTLYDSCHISLFETFLFDCEKDRLDAIRSKDVQFRRFSIWNWSRQFSSKDIELFRSPFYEFLFEGDGLNTSLEAVIIPQYSVSFLQPWAQCYYRWHPSLGISGGGRPLVDKVHWHLSNTIMDLYNIKKSLSSNNEDIFSTSITYNIDKRKSISVDSLQDPALYPDNFYPFSSVSDSAANILAETSAFSDFDAQSLNLTE